MVPPTPTSVVICSERLGPITPIGPRRTRHTYVGQLGDLVAALNAGQHEPPKFVCNAGGLAREYTLDFHYASGPGVAVDIGPDCQPSITNGSFFTNNTDTVLAAITRLTGLR